MIIAPQLKAEIETHVLAEFPKEACGLIVSDTFIRCENVADEPEKYFRIRGADLVAATQRAPLQAVVHSHPGGPLYPNVADMKGQVATAVPWIIVPTSNDGERCFDWTIWGDSLPIAPVIGRKFMHGVTDCYSLIRDVFRLGKDELAKQAVDWPLEPIKLPEYPRDDEWWRHEGVDLYATGFAPAGFREITASQAQPGDVFLAKIRADKLNHGGVLIEGGLLLHHLPMRLSRREPAGIWARHAHLWLRHESVK